MAGERRLHGNLRSFGIANFTNENHVRIVAQNRAQTARERKTGLFVDLNLIYTFELVFNWVFHRNNFANGIVDFV